jgi:hypothetical protein
VLYHHEANDARSDDSMKNNKRLKQPVSPAFQKFGFDKISEIVNGGGNPNIEYRNPKMETFTTHDLQLTIGHSPFTKKERAAKNDRPPSLLNLEL